MSVSSQWLSLGTLKQLDILISTYGDVIFLMKLPVMYRRPIHIFVKYINIHDPNQWYNRTSDVAFLNTTKIQYVEFSSQVAYEQFTVQVRLGSEGVFGNPYDAPGIYGECSWTTQWSRNQFYIGEDCQDLLTKKKRETNNWFISE